MKKQQVMSILVAGLAVGLVGCGKAKTSQPTVAIYHQAKQGTQIWYEVPNHDKITKNTAINSIIVLNDNKITQYSINGRKTVRSLDKYSNKRVLTLAKKWDIQNIEKNYDDMYGKNDNTGVLTTKYSKKEMVNRLSAAPTDNEFTIYESGSNKKIKKESMRFTSKQMENSIVRYDLTKSNQQFSIDGNHFIGYLVTEHVDGATNTVSSRLMQRVSNKGKVASFDSVKEPGITVKKTEN